METKVVTDEKEGDMQTTVQRVIDTFRRSGFGTHLNRVKCVDPQAVSSLARRWNLLYEF